MKKSEKEALRKFRQQIYEVQLPDVKDLENQEFCKKLFYQLMDMSHQIGKYLNQIDG
jgi:hypothetical protein